MSTSSTLRRLLGPGILVLLGVAALYLIASVYATGQSLLALTLLVIVALAAWLFTSQRTYAYRYLYPGIAAAIVFVVFPMIYTVGLGFTNYSSKNLLDFGRATQYLLDETYAGDAEHWNFSLHAEGAQFRARLEHPEKGTVMVSQPFAMPEGEAALQVKVLPEAEAGKPAGEPVELGDVITHQEALERTVLVLPTGDQLKMTGLSEYGEVHKLYQRQPDGSLVNQQDGTVIRPNLRTGFYETAEGEQIRPGFVVRIGFDNFLRTFTEDKFRKPFLQIFVWTVAFSFLSVLFTASLGLILAVLLSWDALRFRSVYRLLLFLPYAVPGFISILVFKGLFNNNLGEINMILNGLFGIRLGWFSNPFLAKVMILIVNTWLGFPYMMVVCMGLIKAIPGDLYEASAVAGAGPLTNFFRITVPLIRRPLMPLLISSFAFNFNNFVLISLLTGGRPDVLDSVIPAGTTDVLITYVYRISFQDSGQQFGLAAAISTLIFLLVAALTIIQIRLTKIANDEQR